jgi:hypothetical protein
MAEAIASDAATVTHWRTHIVRQGAHPRPVVAWPEAAEAPAGRVRVICGDDRGHMQLQAGPIIAAVYPTAAGCRRQGRRGDLLGPWLDAIDAAVGDPLILDELVPDAWYGLRQPGQRRIYEVTRAPDASLAAIAAQIDGP